MKDFTKIMELILTMSDKLKENNPLERILITAVWLFGGGVFVGAIASLVEAYSKL